MTDDEIELEKKLREHRRAMHARMEMLLGQYRAQLERRIQRALADCRDRGEKEFVLEGLYTVAEEEFKEARKRYSAASLLTDDQDVTRQTMDDFYKARERVKVLDTCINQLGAEKAAVTAPDPEPERGRVYPFLTGKTAKNDEQ